MADSVRTPPVTSLSSPDIEGPALYARLQELGYDFGQSFRGISRIRIAGNVATATIDAQGDVGLASMDFPPALLDCCLHTLLAVAVWHAGDGATLLVPTSIAKARFHRKMASTLTCKATLRDAGTPHVAGDVEITTGTGELVATVEGLVLRGGTAATRPTAQAFDLAWREATGARRSAGGTHWTVIGPADVARGVAQQLELRGARATFEELAQWRGAVDANTTDLLCLFPAPGRGHDVDEGALAREVEAALAHAMGTIRAALALERPPRVWLVTKGAVQVAPGDVVTVARAPLAGLARVVAHEAPGAWGALVDADPRAAALTTTAVLDALLTEPAEPVIAVRGDARLAPRMVQRPASSPQRLRVRDDATYLIAGGLSGVGLATAQWLAARGAKHLLLLSRTGRDEGAELEALRAQGVSVRVEACDVADAAQLDAVLARSAATDPPLRGVVHSAAVLDDCALTDLTPERLTAVLRPKVAGSWALHRSTVRQALDFFWLYASQSGWIGPPGQAGYAAANAFQDAVAQARALAGLPATSISWGVWGEVGLMATPEASRAVDAWGLIPMPPADAFAVLDRVAGEARTSTVAVTAVEWAKFASTFPGAAHLVELAAASAPGHIVSIRERLAQGSMAEQREVLRDLVAQEASRVMGLSTSTRVDPNAPLMEMGLDSLMALELRNRLGRILELHLQSTLLFRHPTITLLAEELYWRCQPDDTRKTQRAAPLRDEPSAEELSDALDDIDSLSEEEADALLSEEDDL